MNIIQFDVTTVGGLHAVLTAWGTDNRLRGRVPGHMTSCWWHSDGRHALYRDLDLRPQDVQRFKERC